MNVRNSNELAKKGNSRTRFNDNKNQRKSDQLKAIHFSHSAKNNILSTTHDSVRSQVHSDYETLQLREALCEAIEENEFLRERVIELEALLAEAQGRIEHFQERYVADMNTMQRSLMEGKKGHHCQQRSKSL